MNEKGVIDLIRQFKASRIRSSIRWIDGASKMNPSSLCFISISLGKQIKKMKVEHYESKRDVFTWILEEEKCISFIFAAKEMEAITTSLRTHGLPCCNIQDELDC